MADGTFKKGENQLIDLTLYQEDGTTPLNVSDLVFANAALIQRGRTLQTYVLGTDAELRQGGSANILQLEIKESVSQTLWASILKVQYLVRVTDADFDVDGKQVDIPCLEFNINEC